MSQIGYPGPSSVAPRWYIDAWRKNRHRLRPAARAAFRELLDELYLRDGAGVPLDDREVSHAIAFDLEEWLDVKDEVLARLEVRRGRLHHWKVDQELARRRREAATRSPAGPGGTRAEEWLRGFLERPRPADQVRRAADQAAIPYRTLKRAKRRLGVESLREGYGRGGGWVWRLPVSPGIRSKGATSPHRGPKGATSSSKGATIGGHIGGHRGPHPDPENGGFSRDPLKGGQTPSPSPSPIEEEKRRRRPSPSLSGSPSAEEIAEAIPAWWNELAEEEELAPVRPFSERRRAQTLELVRRFGDFRGELTERIRARSSFHRERRLPNFAQIVDPDRLGDWLSGAWDDRDRDEDGHTRIDPGRLKLIRAIREKSGLKWAGFEIGDPGLRRDACWTHWERIRDETLVRILSEAR